MTYINPQSVIAIGIIFPIAGALAVLTRFHARRAKKTSFGLDDWLCLPALILVTGCSIVMIIGAATHTIGYHSAPHEDAGNNPKIVYLEKLEWAFNIMAPLALGFIKLSILFFYRRIFRGRLFDFLSWGLIGVVLLWTLGFTLTQIFDCGIHFETNWGLLSDLQKCLNTFHLLLAYSISDVIVDVLILVLPLPLVWMLHMRTARKFAVSGIFLLGASAVVAGILRLVVFAQILGAGHTQVVLVILGVTILDNMTVVSLILFWPMVQMGIALITACLPTFRPLFHGASTESIVRSVRSKLSLQSLSRGGRSTPPRTGDETGVERASSDTLARVRYKASCSYSGGDSLEACSKMEDTLWNMNQYGRALGGHIGVKQSMTQSVEHV
ncbi:MAG: hypothetical protein Q9184_003224 [Pyrenodesmia sp. 2 TL-2023]